jgi:predicted nucleic acid-binding protein
MTATVLDTGPLYAFFDANDSYHAAARELFATLEGPRLLPSPVLTEVCWLLERSPRVEARFLDSVADGAFELITPTPGDLTRMSELVLKYQDFSLGAVDASVVAIAERYGVQRIATTDRRHFSAIRPAHVDVLTLVP